MVLDELAEAAQLLFFFLEGGGHFFSAPTAEGGGITQYVSLVTVAPRLRRPKKEMCLGLVFLNSAQKDGECCSRGPQLFLLGGHRCDPKPNSSYGQLYFLVTIIWVVV